MVSQPLSSVHFRSFESYEYQKFFLESRQGLILPDDGHKSNTSN